MTAQDLVDTEEEIRALWEAGDLPYLIHLAGGNEHRLIEIFKDIKADDWVFASHRCHWHWLLHHQTHQFFSVCNDEQVVRTPAEELIERIKKGSSMFLYGPRFVCSAIVAGVAPIAAGMALAIKRRGGSERCFCFIGDGAEDSGHVYEAVWFVEDRGLPCTFIIEDNNSSCGVTKCQRRGTYRNRPWPDCVRRYEYNSTWPHAGSNLRPQLKWKAQ